METNTGTTLFAGLNKKVQKLLKDRYPDLNLNDDSVFVLPGYGSDFDGDYLFVCGKETFDLEKFTTQEAVDSEIKSGLEAGSLKLLANLFSPAIWTAGGGTFHGPESELTSLF